MKIAIIYEKYDNLEKVREIARVDEKMKVTGPSSDLVSSIIKGMEIKTFDGVVVYFSSLTMFAVKEGSLYHY